VAGSQPASAQPTGWSELYLPYAGLYSNRCLDAENAADNPNTNGDKVQIWSCNGGSQQFWQFVTVGSENGQTVYKIENYFGNHLVLDAENDQYDNPWSNGDKIQLWTWNGGCQQQWQIIDVGLDEQSGNQSYGIQSLCSGKVVDAENDAFGNPKTNGDYVQLWDWNSTWNQVWSEP
jgi:hypothetical protein